MKHDLQRVQKLACLSLSDEEEAALQTDITQLLEAFSVLEEVAPATRDTQTSGTLRPDEPVEHEHTEPIRGPKTL